MNVSPRKKMAMGTKMAKGKAKGGPVKARMAKGLSLIHISEPTRPY